MEGKKYKHKNGNIYTVLYLTNTFGGKGGPMERLKDHPIDVVYQGEDGNIWSRRLSDWNRSFTEVTKQDLLEELKKQRSSKTEKILKLILSLYDPVRDGDIKHEIDDLIGEIIQINIKLKEG